MAPEVLQRPLVSIAPMTTVDGARREWAEGHRRFVQEASDPARADVLHRQLDVVTDELRRRVGRDVHPCRARGRIQRRRGLAADGGRRAGAVEGLGSDCVPCRRRRLPRLQPRRAGLRALTLDADTRVARRAARKRRTWPRVLAAVVAAVVLFALGVALGLALDDRPVPGGTQTSLRTLPPLPQTSP